MYRVTVLSLIVVSTFWPHTAWPLAAKEAESPQSPLKRSLETWQKLRAKCRGNYSYTVRWSSWVGFGHETTIVVRGNKVVERHYRKWSGKPVAAKPGKPPGPDGESWTERGKIVGTHKDGASPKVLDELYEEAKKVLNTKLASHQRLYVRFDKQGLLQSCFYVDTRIADDAPRRGIAISGINLEKPTKKTKLPYDSYSGYFVSNKFEPKAAESFVVINDQEQFDKVFGVAMVMGDQSHRLPKDIFKSSVVVAAIKRGKAIWEYRIEGVTEANGVICLRYTTTSKKSGSATFACPLIVSIPKGKYTGVQFVENKKPMKTVAVKKK